MPTRKLPRTNTQRIGAMRIIKTRLESLPPTLTNPIMPATEARLMAFYPQYTALMQAVKLAKAEASGSTAQVAVLRDRARIWVGHGYISIVNATVRGTLNKSVLGLYGLPLGAQGGPKMKSEARILAAADRLATGEAQRVAAGGQPIAFPSVAEIMVHADAFKAANMEQGNRKIALSDAQRALKAANKEADRLILRMWNEVEATFSVGDRPSLRRKAREWGVVYVQSRTEPPTAETSSAMGIITDSATGKPLRGARAMVAGTDIRAKANARGRYALPLMDDGDYTMQFSHKGHITTERTITVTDGQMAVMDVALVPKNA